MLIIKKYSNRRLYDTSESRYITLEELAEKIRGGEDIQVLDARTGVDLTQPTLAQIMLESRGASKMLPPALLTQLIRMGDDALLEFFGQYLVMALQVYLQARRGAQRMSPYYPFPSAPFAATDAMARMFTGASPWASMFQAGAWGSPGAPHAPPAGFGPEPEDEPEPAPERPAPAAAPQSEIAALRQELEALKKSLQGPSGS